MIRKWFFTLSETSMRRKDHGWRGLIRVAVKSAKQNTDLQPHLVYDGAENPFISELRELGVKVIRHRVSFYDALVQRALKDRDYLPICSGVFLRVEIPLLEQEDQFVLYTDCDVMFLRQPELASLCPTTFAAAPMRNQKDYRNDMNTGVMVMNLESMRRDLPGLTRFITEHLNAGWPGCDQENYRRYYDGNWSPLPLEMNWKPYWGINENSWIVHWHGPKPALVRLLLKRPDLDTYPPFKDLFQKDPKAYAYFLGQWDNLAAGNPQSVVGHLDVLSATRIAGWAFNEDNPAEPADIHVWVDQERVGRLDCTGFRRDLAALRGVGTCGFSFTLPESLRDGDQHTITLTDAAKRPIELGHHGKWIAQFVLNSAEQAGVDHR